MNHPTSANVALLWVDPVLTVLGRFTMVLTFTRSTVVRHGEFNDTIPWTFARFLPQLANRTLSLFIRGSISFRPDRRHS
jgi:hypothetical protein